MCYGGSGMPLPCITYGLSCLEHSTRGVSHAYFTRYGMQSQWGLFGIGNIACAMAGGRYQVAFFQKPVGSFPADASVVQKQIHCLAGNPHQQGVSPNQNMMTSTGVQEGRKTPKGRWRTEVHRPLLEFLDQHLALASTQFVFLATGRRQIIRSSFNKTAFGLKIGKCLR